MIVTAEDKYRLLLQVSEAANAHLELSRMLGSVALVLVPFVPLDAIGIATVDGHELRPHAIHVEGTPGSRGESFHDTMARALELSREEYDALYGGRIARAGSGTELVGRTGQPDVCQDLAAERRFPEDERLASYGVRCYVRTALVVRDQLIGSVTFARLQPRPFADEEVRVLEEVTRPMAGAVANALAYEEIARLRNKLHEENLALRQELDEQFMFEEIIGSSPALRSVLQKVERVAGTDSTVLITGETGTGKELIARAIHRRSRRSQRAMIKVNIAALPDTLVPSELFGHEKGAFTGALERRPGRFELANGGTIFLDEVGEVPLETQVALLRVLQEGEFERVGGSHTIKTDARVIAATNRDLSAAVGDLRFRTDLFYRLNVFPIEVPPLRQRPEDIVLLVEYFAARHGTRIGRKFRSVDRRTLDALREYTWPGNVRELENIIERAAILSDGDVLRLDVDSLASLTGHGADGDAETQHSGAPRGRAAGSSPAAKRAATEERRAIERALTETRGRVSGVNGAAARLGVPASTLESRIARLGIDKLRFKHRD